LGKYSRSKFRRNFTDHAWCEQKAATNAIGIITMIPEHTEIVTELLAIAQEEMEHFSRFTKSLKNEAMFLEEPQRRLCK
jgi:tRNA-(ms[2]io[6]A)-hydroxylase